MIPRSRCLAPRTLHLHVHGRMHAGTRTYMPDSKQQQQRQGRHSRNRPVHVLNANVWQLAKSEHRASPQVNLVVWYAVAVACVRACLLVACHSTLVCSTPTSEWAAWLECERGANYEFLLAWLQLPMPQSVEKNGIPVLATDINGGTAGCTCDWHTCVPQFA